MLARVASVVVAALLGSSAAQALPNPDLRFRVGANHHLGDDSFVAVHHRAPRSADSEAERMAVHLRYVRAYLGGRPATSPARAARRAELLGYLDDYIAKGVTPTNDALPWRSPVFIDHTGAICAVGYLIERSVGRALAEQIAAAHRYDYLEDIAAAMPAVAEWIAASGFTIDELASIQPAYAEPAPDTWRVWDLAKIAPPDGPLTDGDASGNIKRGQMDGEWTTKSRDGVVIGRGTLRRGAGTWTGFYGDGKTKLAEGPYRRSMANGRWQFFHPSGKVAAEGAFINGQRSGRWRFYYDDAAHTLLSDGRFGFLGRPAGRWRHYDQQGALLATTWTETPAQFDDHELTVNGGEGYVLAIEPGADGVRHDIHSGAVQNGRVTIETYRQRLERLALGREQIYIHTLAFADDAEVIYDADGNRLAHTNQGWTSANCHWATSRRAIAATGDIARLHGVLYNEVRRRSTVNGDAGAAKDPGPRCTGSRAVGAPRAAILDRMVAARAATRAVTPEFIRRLVLDQPLIGPVDPVGDSAEASEDFARLLAATTVEYREWPQVDKRFLLAFDTMPGRRRCPWAAPCHDNR